MLNDSCLLVSLEIGLPPMTKLAKQASVEVEDKYQTAKRQAKVTKSLFAKRDIQPLQAAANAARVLFNDLSLPYGVGYRIIPVETYFSFVEKMNGAANVFDALRIKFLENYEMSLTRSQAELGSLWRSDDYPSVHSLKERIYFSIDSTVLPKVTAFDELVGITEEGIEDLKRQAVEGQQRKVDSALKDLVKRLHKSLDKAAIRLANTDTYFKDTIIGNIETALDAVESLNITNDPRIIELAQEVRDVIENISPKEMRKDEKMREQAAVDTQKLVDKVGTFF